VLIIIIYGKTGSVGLIDVVQVVVDDSACAAIATLDLGPLVVLLTGRRSRNAHMCLLVCDRRWLCFRLLVVVPSLA
jgi:hypothetical protein